SVVLKIKFLRRYCGFVIYLKINHKDEKELYEHQKASLVNAGNSYFDRVINTRFTGMGTTNKYQQRCYYQQ
ncbi:hypothetical protein RCM25_21035, partial [Escherichia marmotae]|nr:hypothetical protein [Escherichia marmotae]